jgi:putative ABC transport system ATP-binding protein
MAIIKLEKITKIYNTHSIPVTALKDLDLNIEAGEFTAVVGPSGSGKTTLLNIIGGLDKPTSGTVMIEGKNLTKMKQSELIDFRLHRIGFVFQAYNLIPVLTAKENVEFIMLLQKLGREERNHRARELLKSMGLEGVMKRRPTELSGGQQQRVAVARSLASMPAFVLADEPTANLDGASALNLLDIMETLNREKNITFIFSTHDHRVMKRAHRTITLQDGQIVSDKLSNNL